MTDLAPRAREVLSTARAGFATINFAPAQIGHALCAAGLARAIRLTEAIDQLELLGYDDVTGILARTVLESHHVALLALLGGEDGIRALAADHRVNLDRLVAQNTWIIEDGDPAEAWDVEAQKLPVEQIRQRLEKILRQKHGTSPPLQPWYDLMFRGESTYSVHGLGPLTRYLDLRDEQQPRLLLVPTSLSRFGSLPTSTVLVSHIAYPLFSEFGLDVSMLEAQTEELLGDPRYGRQA